MDRVCTCCKVAKEADLSNFPPHKMGKFGLHSLCRPCKKRLDAERRARPDQKARQQAWRDANKDAVKIANAAYRAGGYKSTAHVNAWVLANPERAKELNREKVRRWRKNEPWYNVKCRVSARINTMLKAGGGAKARRSTEALLGYSMAELVRHLESKFQEGMTWDKFMSGEIHLDHIVPVSYFKASSADSEAFKQCWALENLQPLWASDNIAKGDKLPEFMR